MKRKRIIFVLTLGIIFQGIVFLTSGHANNAHEIVASYRDAENFRKYVGELLAHEKYDTLETLAQYIRENKSRLDSGDWYLGYFYDGLELGDGKMNVYQQKPYRDLLARWGEAKPDSITAKIALVEAYITHGFDSRDRQTLPLITLAYGKEFNRLVA